MKNVIFSADEKELFEIISTAPHPDSLLEMALSLITAEVLKYRGGTRA